MRMTPVFLFISGLLMITYGLESYCGELDRCSPKTFITFPTKAELELRCTPPASTDAEWCWLSNYQGCENETFKAQLAMVRRVIKLQCQLLDDPSNEKLLEQIHASHCINNNQKLKELDSDIEFCRYQYEADLKMEATPVTDTESRLCWVFQKRVLCILLAAEEKCGKSVGLYFSQIFLSNNTVNKCMDSKVLQKIMGQSSGCEDLYHCEKKLQQSFNIERYDFRNTTQLDIFCSQKRIYMTDCWERHGSQCESNIWQRQVKEELRLMELVCSPDFKDVASIMSYSALVSVATTVLDCEENFLQIYPGLEESRGDLEYLGKVSCRHIHQIVACIRNGVDFAIKKTSKSYLQALYNQAFNIVLGGQLQKKYNLWREKSEQDINECQKDTHNCTSRAECQFIAGSVQCTSCKLGFYLDNKKRCKDINECKKRMHNCRSRKYCRNIPGTFECKRCKNRFQLNSTNHCIDINECQEDTHVCNSTEECQNTDGSYHCTACKSGFYLNKVGHCKDINECKRKTDNCKSRRHCRNRRGTYICRQCKSGYQLDSVSHCKDINECKRKTDNCKSRRHCKNRRGTYICTQCKSGYQLDSVSHCKDINECEDNSDNCDSNSVCENNVGSYQCVCNKGFRKVNRKTCKEHPADSDCLLEIEYGVLTPKFCYQEKRRIFPDIKIYSDHGDICRVFHFMYNCATELFEKCANSIPEEVKSYFLDNFPLVYNKYGCTFNF